MSPQEDRIGRYSKVGKETIFGFLKALESFVNQKLPSRRPSFGDHDASYTIRNIYEAGGGAGQP